MRKPGEIETEFADRSALDGRSSFFLVGIGGAGMSALARMLNQRGFNVEGSDSTASTETERLVTEGLRVHIGHSGAFVDQNHALVLTDAIDLDASPEVTKAKDLAIPIVRRSQALGWLLKDRKVIAVTGTHGKTTTTGMLGNALIEANQDPLIVVGANVSQFGGPVREGVGEWAVVEACEAYESFRDLDPYVVLLTNLELDHIDYHKTFDNLEASVLRFVDRIPPDGVLVYCQDDAGAAGVAEKCKCRTVGYRSNDFQRIIDTYATVPLLPLSQKGRQNNLNGAGALVTLEALGVVGDAPINGVASFRGAERRQQLLLGDEPDRRFVVIDDYAHHPTEVRESLLAIRSFYFSDQGEKGASGANSNRGRLIVVFQPHLYSRTASLIDEFASALDEADEVVLTDIYPAREDPVPGVSSARIAEKLKKPVHYVPSRYLLPMEVSQMMQEGDVVVGMGAGSISEFGPGLVRELNRRYDLDLLKGAKPLSSNPRPLKIAVVYGGDSAEREVSIHSGREIHRALENLGYEAQLIDVTDVLLKSGNLAGFIGPDRPDLAFLAVHGTHAEDGAIQGLLELLHIPYTGSGIQASAIAMDKAMTKRILSSEGIRTPKGALLTELDPPIDIQPPMIVKPNAQGSTVGLSFIRNRNDLCPALRTAFAYDSSVLVEEWIIGMEISVPVLCGKALPPVEIAPTSGKYDFESKYTPGATEEIVPARLSNKHLVEAQEIALKAHAALRCTGATRTDMMVRGDEIYVLELNTLPGMTKTSLLPRSAAAADIPFDRLCQILVEDGLANHAKTKS